MCTSTSTSRHWPFFTSFRASSGSDVEIASYPKSAITAANISSCAGSSSRMQGVNADFGVTISTVFVDANPTIPYLWQPVCHSPCATSILSQSFWTLALQSQLYGNNLGYSFAPDSSRGRLGPSPAVGGISRFESVPQTAFSAPFRSQGLPPLPIPAQSRCKSAQIKMLSPPTPPASLKCWRPTY